MKFGYEVEGRLKNLRTIFLTAEEFNLLYDDLLPKAKKLAAVQLYISDHTNIIDMNDSRLNTLSKDLLITIEVTELADNPPQYVNIILSITNDSFWKLKYTDQIKVSKGLYVKVIPVENMMATSPIDFKGDIEL